MGNLIKSMKDKIAKSGANKKEILYFGKDSVKRIRFLQELDAGFQFRFHNDWSTNIFELCADQDGDGTTDCKLCDDGISIQEHFIWSVWDYDSNAVRLMQFKATGVTPIPAFIEMFEEFGTIKDRDYKVKKVGSGQGSSFVVTPLDKERFKNQKAKPYNEKAVNEILAKAWVSSTTSDEADDDEDDEEETKPAKKASKKPAKKKKEPTLRERFEELELKELRTIALEIGMSKKEIRALDEEELLDELFDSYEEEDLEELLDDSSYDDED